MDGADLVEINIRLVNKDNMQYIPIHCAVSSQVINNLVLTADAVQRLAIANGLIMRRTDDNETECQQTEQTLLQDEDFCSIVNDNELIPMREDDSFFSDATRIANSTSMAPIVPDDRGKVETDFFNFDSLDRNKKTIRLF